MTASQIYDLIERNKCIHVQVRDYQDNKLLTIEDTQSAKQAVEELKDALPNFKDYRKLEIRGKRKNDPNWNSGFVWYLEFDKGEAANKGIAGPAGNQSIGAMDFVNAMIGMQEKNFALQLEKYKAENEKKENDPTKWIPVFQAIAPALGFPVNPLNNGIRGPQTSELIYGDIDTKKMSEDQKNQLITETLLTINKKIGPVNMLTLVTVINQNPDLKNNISKILQLFQAINQRPELLDMAMKFI